MQAVKVDEDLLGYVLGLGRVGQHAVGYPDDAGVLSCE
jgi:hypothetical protein